MYSCFLLSFWLSAFREQAFLTSLCSGSKCRTEAAVAELWSLENSTHPRIGLFEGLFSAITTMCISWLPIPRSSYPQSTLDEKSRKHYQNTASNLRR